MKNATKLSKRGKPTSALEITHISQHGVWVLIEDHEFLLSYKEFPWFKKGTVEQIHHVVAEGKNHFHWPDLDVDLDLDRIKEPAKYPLIAKISR